MTAPLWVSEHEGAAGAGDDLLVLLAHGSMDRSASWAKVQRQLDGLTVVRYDRRGYGRSLHAGVSPSVQDHVDDLLEVLGDRPAVVAGHSFGGVLALAGAEQRPDLVRGVLAYEPPLAWLPWWPATTAGGEAMEAGGGVVPGASGAEPIGRLDADLAGDAAERFLRSLVGDERWERLPARIKAERRAEGRALVAELTAIRGEAAPCDLAAVTVPVVVAHGTESAEHHRRAVREVAAAVPGAELATVAGAGHGAHASHPGPLAELVRGVLVRCRR